MVFVVFYYHVFAVVDALLIFLRVVVSWHSHVLLQLFKLII